MKASSRSLVIWVFLALILIMLFTVVSGDKNPEQQKLSFTEVVNMTKSDDIGQLTFSGKEITGTLTNGQEFTSYGPNDIDRYFVIFEEHGIIPNFEPEKDNPLWYGILLNSLPLLLIFFLFIFLMRQVQVGGGKAMSFGKSKAKIQTDNKKKVTFADVSGVDEAKDELLDIIEFLKDPKRYTRLGGRIPKGVLLMGTPGTGKTLMARAIAGEAGVPFFSISGSEFVEMFVGVGASRVRDLFEQGKKHAPCLIFIDEIDAVGRHRGAGMGGGHDEREQTLNQLLVEMDGFDSNEGVILIAATNRPDVLDPALLRPGRFDRRVMVPNPDVRGREGILRVHCRKVRLADDVDAEVLAKGTPGFSGADLENLVNEAALLGARLDKEAIDMSDFEAAKDKVMMGPERRSMLITESEKKVTAYHEAGHAIVAHMLPGTDPIHRVTIIPRGRALGLTQQLPQEDRYSHSRDYLLNTIAILMGGRVAEEIALGSITTGAGNDIERATDLARKMVCEWGMSDKLGPMSFGKQDEQVFLGRGVSQKANLSESTSQEVDKEIHRIISESYEKAKTLLVDNIELLGVMAASLLENETLNLDNIKQLIEELELSDDAPAALS